MKPIEQTLKKSLTLLVASFLSLQAAHTSPAGGAAVTPFVFPSMSCSQAWQDLQGKMASLSATSAPEDLVAVEASVVTYQSAVALLRYTNWQEDQQRGAFGLVEDLINADYSNPVVPPINSVEFGSVENELLHARVGPVNDVSFITKFYMENESLLETTPSDFITWQKDLQNADPTNPAAMNQVKLDEKIYSQDRAALCNSAHDYKKSELQDAVNAAALTPDEQQLWGIFQATLTAKYKAAYKNYRATATFPDNENVDLTNPAAVLEAKLYKKEEISAHLAAFKLLEQGCRYEFLNVLLSKRNDTDSSLNSFHQLQDKLNQFLNNVDVNTPVAALQAQVDMLAYEKEVGAVTTVSAVK